MAAPNSLLVLEAAPDAMVVVDRAGVIVYLNAQAEGLFGYPRAELLGQAVEELIPSRLRDRHPADRDRYTEMPFPRPMGAPGLELFGLRKDGSEFPAEISLSPVTTDGETLFIAAIRDGTERKRAEQLERQSRLEAQRLRVEAESALQARDALISIVSHELKTPLNALHLNLQMLLRTARQTEHELAPDWVASRLEIATGEVRRFARLIDELLEVSRITAGQLSLTLEDVDLARVVGDVVAREAESLRDVPVTVTAPRPVVGRWDRMRLEQVFTNLLSNAVKYGEGRSIAVEVGSDDGCARLVVRDAGMGIALEDQARVFERFERAVPDRSYGGFGLGLWIIRRIVQSLGGTIALESERGKGSAFTVSLPLAGAGARADGE